MFDTLFTKTYELPLSRNYVRHWGLTEAVRELLQNAIDSDSPLEWVFEGDSLSIISRYSSLPISSLLLGTTSKAEDDDKIGSFGEGYKIALLVLTRAGYSVVVDNGDKTWVPSFKYSKTFEDEVLVIESCTEDRQRKGLKFTISGLSEQDKLSIKEMCLQMQEPDDEYISTSLGDILPNRAGKLYVGGLFVCNTTLQFGYNMKPHVLQLERDRQTVSGWDLKYNTVQMWYEANDYDRVAKMIEDGVEDVSYAEYNQTQMIKEACYKLFRSKHPQGVVAANQQELEQLVRQGMTTVIISPAASIIRGSVSYQSEKRVEINSPHKILTGWLSKNRSEMRSKSIEAFKKELLTQATKWKL